MQHVGSNRLVRKQPRKAKAAAKAEEKKRKKDEAAAQKAEESAQLVCHSGGLLSTSVTSYR